MIEVSVIVPVYNAKKYIGRCAASLFNQSLSNIEFIFVDDCSTDDSIEVLNKELNNFGERISYVKLIRHTENKGVATARNTGLNAATGKYIAWLDADDWIEPDMLEKMYQEAECTGADILWTDFYNVYESTKDYIVQKSKCSSLEIIESLLNGQIIGALWNKLIRRSLFIENDIKFPDGLNMCEDLRVSIALFYYAKSISYLPEAFYHYIKYREDSISTQNALLPKKNVEWIENLKGIEQFLVDKGLSSKVKELLLIRKLSPKKNLLVKGNSIEAFKEWRMIFPESNKYIWQTNMPIHYKILAWCVDKQLWFFVKAWLLLKYRLIVK